MVGWDRWKNKKPRQGMLKVVKRAFAARGRCWAPGLNCPMRPAVRLAGWGWSWCTPLLLRVERGWEGVVGKRAEAQMRVVVDKACDDDDDGVGGGQMPWVCPHSPWRRLGPSRGALSTGVPRPQKRGWWWYEFKEDDCMQCTVRQLVARSAWKLWTPLGTLRSHAQNASGNGDIRERGLSVQYCQFTHLQTLQPSLYLIQYTLNSIA